MRANELRIGNWIYDPLNKTEFQIDVFLGSEYCTNKCEFDSQEFDAKIEDCKPIPLTEEWLLKFGFENPSVDKRTFCDSYKKKNIKLLRSYSGNFYYGKLYVGTVHQLQNLYFALTNEELTLQS